ncbi:MAG: N-acetylmuramoyl-L-alanine amidase [Synergistaceae bacterium]|nr:N-acetylmuramoyl-L-alanine amidase [Synergistaceae bacterium]
MKSVKKIFIASLVLVFFILCSNVAKATEAQLLDGGKQIGTVTVKNEYGLQLVSVASLFKVLGLEAKSSDNNGLFASDKSGRSVCFFDGTNVVRSLGEFIIAKKTVKYEKPYLWCDSQAAFAACQKFLKANGRSVSLSLKVSGQEKASFFRDSTRPITITVESEKNNLTLDELLIKSAQTTKTAKKSEEKGCDAKITTEAKPQESSNTKTKIIVGTNQPESNITATGQIGQVIAPNNLIITNPPTKMLKNQPIKPTTSQKFVPAPLLAKTKTTSEDSVKANNVTQKQASIVQKVVSVSESKTTTTESAKPAKQEFEEPKPTVIQIPKTAQLRPEQAYLKDTPAVPPVQRVANTTSQKPIVVLDAGHGGHDPGAMANNVREKDIVLKAVLELAEILRNRGIDVHLTRSTDVYLKLSERTAIANKLNANVFVSLHCNSLAKKNSSVSGLEYYIMALPRDKDSMALALAENKELAGGSNVSSSSAVTDKKTKILLQILGDMQQNDKIDESTTFAEYLYNASRATGLKMRKVAQAPFFVLRGAAMPAVLAELGYLTNKEEAQKLTTYAYRQKLCNTIASGIIAYLNEHPTITE